MLFIGDDGKPIPISRDVEYAFALLRGIGYVTKGPQTPRRQVKKAEFPSAITKPTEKEARAALARVLRADGPPEVLKAREHLLPELAKLFDPDSRARRRVVFKNLNQGHGDLDREMGIAWQMMSRIDEGASYERAAEEVAELCGIGGRQVKKFYQKNRNKFAKIAVGEDWARLLKVLATEDELNALSVTEDQLRALKSIAPGQRRLTEEDVTRLLQRLPLWRHVTKSNN